MPSAAGIHLLQMASSPLIYIQFFSRIASHFWFSMLSAPPLRRQFSKCHHFKEFLLKYRFVPTFIISSAVSTQCYFYPSISFHRLFTCILWYTDFWLWYTDKPFLVLYPCRNGFARTLSMTPAQYLQRGTGLLFSRSNTVGVGCIALVNPWIFASSVYITELQTICAQNFYNKNKHPAKFARMPVFPCTFQLLTLMGCTSVTKIIPSYNSDGTCQTR